jgi:putative ABC transport system permease protein
MSVSRWKNAFDSIQQDLHFSMRQMRRSPVVTLAVVITLALGMGANAAMFSMVNAWLLRPLPLKDPQQLVSIWRTSVEAPRQPAYFDLYHDYLVWVSGNRTLQSLAATFEQTYALTRAGEPKQVHGAVATWNLFSTVGAVPAAGRLFSQDDVHGEPSCVISHALWTSNFHSSPEVIGQGITLNGKIYRVLGVLPSNFTLRLLDRPFETDVWTLITAADPKHTVVSPSPVSVIGRLKLGITAGQAEADLAGLQHELDERFKDYPPGTGILVAGLQQDNTRTIRSSLLLLFGAVTVLLMIACVNAGSLIVGRNSQRSAEFGVRIALGCSVSRLLQQLTIEILVVFALGGAVGLIVAAALIKAFVVSNPFGVLPAGGITIDKTVLAGATLAVFATALLFGSLPAFRALRGADSDLLRARAATATRSELRARMMFVAVEFALSVVLLVGAGLLISTFSKINSEPLGFQTHDVYVTDVSLPYRDYPDLAAQSRFLDQLLLKLRSLPSVHDAGIALAWPFEVNGLNPVEMEGRPASKPEQMPQGVAFITDGAYFGALGIPILQGRTFNQQDRANTPRVAVINDEMARQFFAGQNPIGQRIRLRYPAEKAPTEPWVTIVGVAGATRSVRYNQIQWDRYPAMYTCIFQQSDKGAASRFDSLTVYVYLQGHSIDLPLISAAVHSVDANLPVDSLRSTSTIVNDLRAQPRLRAVLLAGFGLLTLVLAAVGVYGVMTQLVEQRRREIGIRMALGAIATNIMALVLRRALLLTGAGVVAGIVAAAAVTRMMQGFMYGTSVLDPKTFTAVVLMLGLVALLASYLPARRAARIDPAATLRAE